MCVWMCVCVCSCVCVCVDVCVCVCVCVCVDECVCVLCVCVLLSVCCIKFMKRVRLCRDYVRRFIYKKIKSTCISIYLDCL